MEKLSSNRGQTSAELVAVIPLLLAMALVLAQLAVAGWALLTAGEAARAAARAAHVGSDPAAAARRAVPLILGIPDVDEDDGRVSVRVRAPALVPGFDGIPVQASAALEPQAGTR